MSKTEKELRAEFEADIRNASNGDVIKIPSEITPREAHDIYSKLRDEEHISDISINYFEDDYKDESIELTKSLFRGDVIDKIRTVCGVSKQVGGDHYSRHTIQPWDIIDEYELDYYLGNVIKYVLRDKVNKYEDLKKAMHYLEKKIELME